jgi:hypothetical protein
MKRYYFKTITYVSFLVLWVTINLLILTCSSETKEEIDPTVDIINLTPIVVEKEISKEPCYYDGHYNWEIQFSIYTNCHHPSGYVIITCIKKFIDDEKEVWTIDHNTSNYIEEIHYNLKARHNGNYEENNVFLPTDLKFRNAFRTAEAIYIAWIAQGKENPVTLSSITEARMRMEGRLTGIKIE